MSAFPTGDHLKPHKTTTVAVGGVRAWAQQIGEAWKASVSSTITVGQVLKRAHAQLTKEEWVKLVGSHKEKGLVPFGYTTAVRYIAIASDKRLVAHGQLLPNHWRTLYELTLLPDEAFKDGVKSGRINPDMERADARALARPAVQHAVLRDAGLGDDRPVIDVTPDEPAPPPATPAALPPPVEVPSAPVVEHDPAPQGDEIAEEPPNYAEFAIDALHVLGRAMERTDVAAIIAECDGRGDEPLTADFVQGLAHWLNGLAGELRARKHPPEVAEPHDLMKLHNYHKERMAEAALEREQADGRDASRARNRQRAERKAEAEAETQEAMRERDRAGKPN
jgi:hypothetical protein